MSVLIDTSKNYGINLDATACKDIEEIEQFIYLVPGGFKFLDGIVTQIEKQFIHDLAMVALKKHSVEVVARLLRNFQQLTYQLNAHGFFKAKIVDWPIPVFMEKNLLSNLVASKVELSKVLLAYSKQPKLHSEHAVGAFFLSLATESGLLICRQNLGLVSAFLNEISELNGEYFVETNEQYQSSSLQNVRRLYIDPLSLVIFQKHGTGIKAAISHRSTDDEGLLKYIKQAMLGLVNLVATAPLKQSDLIKQIKSDFILRLPGYVIGRLTHQTPSYDVPLSVVARAHGQYVSATPADLKDVDSAEESEDNDFSDEDKSSKRERAVNANWVLAADFEAFIDWVDKHPGLCSSQKSSTSYLLNMAFYLGLRRHEAYGIRCCDVLVAKNGSTIRVRKYEGNSLKSANGKRNLAMSWLPKGFQEELKAHARKSPMWQRGLIHLFAGRRVSKAIFDLCNRLLKEFFNDPNLTLHSLRHSFASRSLLKLQASTLRLNELDIPDFIRQETADAEAFSKSIWEHQRPTSESLWALSKIMGHADPKITLTSYLHCLDHLTRFSFAATRPPGYDAMVNQILGIDRTQAKRARASISTSGLGWQYPNGAPKAYLPPIKRITKTLSGVQQISGQAIASKSHRRSPQWDQLCDMKMSVEQYLDQGTNGFAPEVLSVISKPMRSGIDLQVMSCLRTLSLNKLPLNSLAEFIKGYSYKHSNYSVQPSEDRAQLLAALKAAGLVVEIKDLNSGIRAPYRPYEKAKSCISGSTNILVRLGVTNTDMKVSPQCILWLLCGHFAMTKKQGSQSL